MAKFNSRGWSGEARLGDVAVCVSAGNVDVLATPNRPQVYRSSYSIVFSSDGLGHPSGEHSIASSTLTFVAFRVVALLSVRPRASTSDIVPPLRHFCRPPVAVRSMMSFFLHILLRSTTIKLVCCCFCGLYGRPVGFFPFLPQKMEDPNHPESSESRVSVQQSLVSS